ncbi:UNVERIFIED_CONTAM: hypothetical protein K2H54_038506 [Gekko kuhli]
MHAGSTGRKLGPLGTCGGTTDVYRRLSSLPDGCLVFDTVRTIVKPDLSSAEEEDDNLEPPPPLQRTENGPADNSVQPDG